MPAKKAPALVGHPPLTDLLPGGGVVVGVDPGSHTGLVAITVDGSLDLRRAAMITHCSLAPSQAKRLWGPRQDAEYGMRIGAWFDSIAPTHIAFEEPKDAKVAWRGYQNQRTETSFRLGAYYGLAVAAAGRITSALEVASYPVTTSKKDVGWMGGRRREIVFAETQAVALALKNTDGKTDPLTEWSEHELMALGVVLHHLRVIEALRSVARMARLTGRAPV